MEWVGKQNNYLEFISGYLVFQVVYKQVSMCLEMVSVKIYFEIQFKIIICLLNNQCGINKLESLGLSIVYVEQLWSLGYCVNGMFIVIGFIGSGKFIIFKVILWDIWDNFFEKVIFSIEDLVEDQLDGIIFLEVIKYMGFVKVLCLLLCYDLDVIMVGEIWDVEIVELVLCVSMIGYLVLIMLYINDFYGVINCLCNLGLDNVLLVENLMVVIVQCLVNWVCKYCLIMVLIIQL